MCVCVCVCVCVCETTDGVWIGEWIYLPLIYTTRNYILEITDTHRLVSSVYYSLH
jgi:hypothetical protein